MGLAERYWLGDANSCVASRFNLGLFYSLDIVSREADAIDTWRRALKNSLDTSLPRNPLPMYYPTFSSERRRPGALGQPCSCRNSGFAATSAPFGCLVRKLRTTSVVWTPRPQKLKKAVLREIEFEDGKIAWVDGLVLDRSRAIH
jgi:hypothetical protein